MNGTETDAAARSRVGLSRALAVGAIVALVVVAGSAATAREGGVVRVALRSADLDSLDPALSYSVASGTLLDPTCARLLRPTPSAGLQPEVAAGLPSVSSDARTFVFRLRSGFRFSDGTPVRASAFARAISRTLAPGMRSPWAAYTRDIAGAEDVRAGRRTQPAGVVARGNNLVVRLSRSEPDFPARTTFLCAAPPSLPADPEGVAVAPAAGPYYVAEYRPGERVVIRRNLFYGGKRPHHVDGFTVDLRAGSWEEVLDRIESGKADWGWALAPTYFDPARRLAVKYGVNRSQFFVRPGTTFRGYAFNTSRPLFRNNLQLRRAVNFAIARGALREAGGGALSSRLTDQYLPASMPGFKDVAIYPLHAPDLRRARALARGHTRSGKLLLYTIDAPSHLTFAQGIKQSLRKIGLTVEIKAFPLPAYFGRVMARGAYDLGFATWTPDYGDPYSVLNVQLDGRFVGATNWPRLNSPTTNRLLREAARLQGAARYRTYGELDVKLARDVAPMLAVDHLNDPTLVSKRVGCVGRAFDLASICLR